MAADDAAGPAPTSAPDNASTKTGAPARSVVRTQRAATADEQRLYRPPMRTDRVSVVGAEPPGRTRGITPEEAAKFEAIERRPSPVAIRAGEEEKERRREESRRRKELRRQGIDPGPRDRSDSGPGKRVGETQEVLDDEADQLRAKEQK